MSVSSSTSSRPGSTSSVPELNLIVFRGELDDNLRDARRHARTQRRGRRLQHRRHAGGGVVRRRHARRAVPGTVHLGQRDARASRPTVRGASCSTPTAARSPRATARAPAASCARSPTSRPPTESPARRRASRPSTGRPPRRRTPPPSRRSSSRRFRASRRPQVRTALTSTAIDIEDRGRRCRYGRGHRHGAWRPRGWGRPAGRVPERGRGGSDRVIRRRGLLRRAERDLDAVDPPDQRRRARATAISAVLSTSTSGVTITGASSTYRGPGADGERLEQHGLPLRGGRGFPVREPDRLQPGRQLWRRAPADLPLPDPRPAHRELRRSSPTPGRPCRSRTPRTSPEQPGRLRVRRPLPWPPAEQASTRSPSRSTAPPATPRRARPPSGIDHTFVNDLRITLHSPTGTAIQVIRNTDGSGNNFCQTLLDDAGTDGSIQAVATGAGAVHRQLHAVQRSLRIRG